MATHLAAEIQNDERGALLAFIEEERGGIRRALLGLTEEQARSRPTAGELSLGGLVKHAAEVEQSWIAMARQEPQPAPRDQSTWHESFELIGDETVASQLARWEEVAAETEKYIRAAPSLDDTFPLPSKPWFPPESRVSLRWLCLHLIRETARHAGHADIIRETLDGKTAYELVGLARAAQEA